MAKIYKYRLNKKDKKYVFYKISSYQDFIIKQACK